jgi:hypothetical protein
MSNGSQLKTPCLHFVRSFPRVSQEFGVTAGNKAELNLKRDTRKTDCSRGGGLRRGWWKRWIHPGFSIAGYVLSGARLDSTAQNVSIPDRLVRINLVTKRAGNRGRENLAAQFEMAQAENGVVRPTRQRSTLRGVMRKRNLDQGAVSGCGLPPRIFARAFW